MSNWIKSFFAVDNSVNENTVMGFVAFVSALALAIAAIWLPVSIDIVYFLLGYSAASFGFGAFKK